jgi:hypothetical protein
VEIKATSGGVPGAVLSVLQRHAIEEQTLVTSFDAPVLRSLRGLGWTGRSGLLIGSRSLNLRQRAYEAWPIGALEVSQATDLVIHHQLLHRPLRQALAHRRIGLLLWTSLEDESKPEATRRLLYEKLQRTEVDGIIVARVAECRSVLAEAERFRHGHHA